MEKKEVKELEEQDKGEKKEGDAQLPYCTTAPSAEHARAHDDDEPCDDSRDGDNI